MKNYNETWITSDLHFGHKNIAKYCPKYRGHFESVQHMNQFMIDEWNKNVQPDDLVYFLGDFSFDTVENTCKILDQLNGDIILIIGNHDSKMIKDENFKSKFIETHYYLEIKHNKHNIVLSHFLFLVWNRSGHGSLHCHGHCHGGKTGLEKYRVCDVGFDATGNVVSKLSDIVDKIKNNDTRNDYH